MFETDEHALTDELAADMVVDVEPLARDLDELADATVIEPVPLALTSPEGLHADIDDLRELETRTAGLDDPHVRQDALRAWIDELRDPETQHAEPSPQPDGFVSDFYADTNIGMQLDPPPADDLDYVFSAARRRRRADPLDILDDELDEERSEEPA